MESEGEAAFNTNRIATRAGVSIGTLYQYFARKEDILIELAMRQTAEHRSYNKRLKDDGRGPQEAIRASIRFYINLMKDTPATRRAAVRVIRDESSAQQMGKSTDSTSYLLPYPKGSSRTDAFILSRAVMGVVQAAVLEDYKGLYGKAFEDGLIRLIESYRTGDP